MAVTAFCDDSVLMSAAYLSRDYSRVKKAALDKEFTYSVPLGDEVLGYICQQNEPLSALYGFECLVVRFAFSGIDNLHRPEQEAVLTELCANLRQNLEARNAYINIRMPSHIIDLTRAFNHCFSDAKVIFCGGTVEDVQCGAYEKVWLQHPEVKLFFADGDYLKNKRERLISLAHDSFRDYQGQYHISPVTSDRAGEVYSDWIRNSIERAGKDSVLVAEVDGEVAGYVTLHWADRSMDGLLSSVDARFRKHNVYKSMITYLIDYARQHDGYFMTSTQFDNFIVQGVWASMGMKPFYSIYNMHYDCRKDHV